MLLLLFELHTVAIFIVYGICLSGNFCGIGKF
jgi:hypothetical protein